MLEKMKPCLICVLLGVVFAACAVGQEKNAPAQPVQRLPAVDPFGDGPAFPAAKASTGLPFDLANLVLAKFDDRPEGPQLLALMEQFRQSNRDVNVVRIRTEARTQKVLVGPEGNQKEVEQTYTVNVPFTETKQVAASVSVGKKPTALPMDKLKIYRLDGSIVSVQEARTLLEKMTPVFLLRGFKGDIKPVGGVYQQALSPNCLIVVTDT